MDSYREHPSDFEPAFGGGEDRAADPAPLEIGTDERRMHVRAYNYWASLLDGRDYPSIEDLEPGDLRDFAPHSVLLDFTAGRDNPATSYIGDAIRAECGLGEGIQSIEDVPARSLLSRLTDHYMQIIANRAPVGFEAEFVNQRGDTICYRGILMPFSSDGDTIDFIYGVINWKTVADSDDGQVPFEPQACWTDEEQGPATMPIRGFDELADDSPDFAAEAAAAPADDPEPAAAPADDDGPAAEPADDDEPEAIELGDDAGLGDRLWAARETAEAVKVADGRSRAALYRALSHAYDFAVASKEDPQGYAELLEESGMKPQARAPMTAVVKLVFGIDYDKARLTEFAAALAYADRQQVAIGGFLALIEAQAGGLKALVTAERQARRPASTPDTRTEAARSRLRQAAPLAAIESDEEFALVLTRRASDGSHEIVAMVEDPAMVERAIRRAGA